MIDRAAVQEIKQLLAAKVPQRQIEKRVGVSRGTISLIAKGYEPPQQGRSTQQNKDLAMLNRRHERCPGCGGLVQMPCLLCASAVNDFAARVLGAIQQNRFRARRVGLQRDAKREA